MAIIDLSEHHVRRTIDTLVALAGTTLPKPKAQRTDVVARGTALMTDSIAIHAAYERASTAVVDPRLSEAQRLCDVMLAIAECDALRPRSRLARQTLALAAVLTASQLTARDGDTGILEQCSEAVLSELLVDEQVPMESRRESLARVCEHALERLVRARSSSRKPRPRPSVGETPIINIGTPLTRITHLDQEKCLDDAEHVARAVTEFGFIPDVPGRAIVAGMPGIVHADEREEEAESTLMSEAGFIGVDGAMAALGMGYAAGRMELWNGAVLLFGDYPSGGGLTRVYPGSMHGRWSRPMLNEPDYLFEVTTDFLNAKAGVILARNDRLRAAMQMPAKELVNLHAQITDADPYAFDGTALTHRKALLLTSSRVHYLHMTNAEKAVLRQLGLVPTPRYIGDTVGDAPRALSVVRGFSPTSATVPPPVTTGPRLDARGYQSLQAFKQSNSLNDSQVLTLIDEYFEPSLAVSKFGGSPGYQDWLRIAQQLTWDVQ